MAAITTAQAGNWSATATWTGGVVPGNGDTVTLNHAVTCNDNRTVGVSPGAGAATAAILCNAALTVDGATLTCRGDIKLNDVGLILNNRGIFEFDASQAGTPSTALYICAPTDHNQASARVTANGTSGSLCTIRSVNTNGGANGRIDNNGFLRGGMVTCTYTNFLRVGDGTYPHYAIYWFPSNGADALTLDHCTFDTCGPLLGDNNMVAGVTLHVTNCTTKNSLGSNSIELLSNTTSTSIRELAGCVFDKNAVLTSASLTVTPENIFLGGYTGGASTTYVTWSGNLVRSTDANDYSVFGDVLNDYWLKDGAISNPHYFQWADGGNWTVDGAIFELSGGTATDGDIISMPSPASARTYVVKNCLALPNDNGGESGDFISALGNANVTFQVRHNTYVASNQVSNGCRVGETYNAHAGMCTLFKDNIAWHATSGGHKFTNTNGAPNNNVVSPANANFNAGWNLQAGSQLKGYNTPMTGGSPGANDVDGDPQFVDRTRNIKTWDTSLGGPGTVAHALAELGKRNEAGYNSAYTVAALRTYVRAGFMPQATAIRSAASDSTTIGAVQWVSSSQVIDSDYLFYQIVQT